jgi:hypothetical protein
MVQFAATDAVTARLAVLDAARSGDETTVRAMRKRTERFIGISWCFPGYLFSTADLISSVFRPGLGYLVRTCNQDRGGGVRLFEDEDERIVSEWIKDAGTSASHPQSGE